MVVGPDLDANYVDGIAITVGVPRRHVFTFAHGLSDSFEEGSAASECPCDGGTAPPAFVGTEYLCEAPRVGELAGTRVFDTDDILFDGQSIDDPSCVGSFESAPAFRATLGVLTIDAIEVRLMQNQGPEDEDIVIISLELWVR